jgi:carotenoid cleavage dioxygenase-like enzyme
MTVEATLRAASPIKTKRVTALSEMAPFRHRAEEVLERDASVHGRMPEWLTGDLLRTAPAVLERNDWRAEHWFDGLALLYAFSIEAGRVRFRQRLMETEVEKAARDGKTPRATFGSPILRSFWKRLLTPIPTLTDNTNVHILPFGRERVALTESQHQWVVDPVSLAATRPVTYDDRLGGRMTMIAHAHMDFARDRIVNVGLEFGPWNSIVVYEHTPNGRARSVIGRVKVPRMPLVHSFGLTAKHAALFGHPFDVSTLSMLWSDRAFVDHFQFHESQPTKLWLLDRTTQELRTHEAPAGFVFHTVNTFEDGGDTVLDVAQYRDVGIVSALRRERLLEGGLPAITPSLFRYRMSPNRTTAKVEVLLENGFEFPGVNYRARSGQRHDVVWGARFHKERGNLATEIVRWTADREAVYAEPGMIFGEPVYVPRPDTSEEDDGVLLVVGAHTESERSSMIALDARTMDLIARADVDVPIPLGFHGSFFRA